MKIVFCSIPANAHSVRSWPSSPPSEAMAKQTARHQAGRATHLGPIAKGQSPCSSSAL